MEKIYKIRIFQDGPKVSSDDMSLPLLQIGNCIVAQLIYKDMNGESVLLPLSYEYNREFLKGLINKNNGKYRFHIQLMKKLIHRNGKLFMKLYIESILFDVTNNVQKIDIII
jgi:hypothetical protein